MKDAYHCRILTPVKQEFARRLDEFDFLEPRHPIFRNVDGERYTKHTIKQGLVDHFDHTVMFQRGIEQAVAYSLDESVTKSPAQDSGLTIIDVGSQGFLMKAVEDIPIPTEYNKVVFNS